MKRRITKSMREGLIPIREISAEYGIEVKVLRAAAKRMGILSVVGRVRKVKAAYTESLMEVVENPGLVPFAIECRPYFQMVRLQARLKRYWCEPGLSLSDTIEYAISAMRRYPPATPLEPLVSVGLEWALLEPEFHAVLIKMEQKSEVVGLMRTLGEYADKFMINFVP